MRLSGVAMLWDKISGDLQFGLRLGPVSADCRLALIRVYGLGAMASAGRMFVRCSS